ncbi:DEKNAAC102748 [Brettanomyces naardenensis]|uniref:Nuclear pore protein n=1 Tax=Brettanomyces naardenensis TaxID=13370 RepID=A0A448YLK0_BRENA|nr:DEKNAAC102748 [Brettanomyces naardenensis]
MSKSSTAIALPGDKPTAASLNELLQSSRNLPRRSNEIGTIHLGLGEIKKKAYKMRKYNKTAKDVNPYTKAHYLLIGKGITIEEIQSELDSLDSLRTAVGAASGTVAASNAAAPSVGIEDYVTAQKHQSILTAIEQSLSSSARDFDQYVSENVSQSWKNQNKDMKSAALSSLLKREQPTSAPSSPEKRHKQLSSTNEGKQQQQQQLQLTWGTKPSSSILSPRFKFSDVQPSQDVDSVVNPNASYALRRKFELYAQVIYELNDARQESAWYQLCTVFADLSKRELTTRSKQMHQGWLILRDFCEDEGELTSVRERRFAAGHCSESLNDPESRRLRKLIAAKSRRYLELQFLDHVNDVYQKLEKKAVGEGLVSNVSKIRQFLELTLKTKAGEWKVKNLTFVNGVPIWATLFSLLRAGCYDEAVTLVSENDDSFQKLERSFPLYLKAYCETADHRLPAELQGRLANEFNQYFKHSSKEVDPYRYAVYKVLGRCDLSRKDLPSITLSIEDWLWLHLCLVREDDLDSSDEDTSIHERYTLTDLQKSVLEFGPDAFNASSNNPLYLQTLLFSGLYEVAVQYLFSVSEIDSVHLAITLAYYGLLRVPDEKEDLTKLLIVDDKGFRCINYARLLGYYTRTFKYSDPRVAAEYLFEICLCDGLNDKLRKEQIDLAQGAIRELVLETREFVMLLGRIGKDGSRIPGIIEQRKKLLYLDDERSYLHKIAEKAAHKAEDEGRPYDCILLYQLSEEYDTVLSIVNRLLGDFLVSVDFRTPLDDIVSGDLIRGDTNVVKLAKRLMKTYNASPEILSRTSIRQRETCSTLLELVSIASAFTSRSPDLVDILQRVKKLDLTPCSSSIELDKIRLRAQEFNSLDEAIAKNIPNVLVIEMSCVSQLVYELQQGYEVEKDKKSSEGKNTSKEERLNELKQMSRNCMVYAGMVQYKMPREVYRTLINLEVDL